jgi:chaperonin GroES
VNRTKLEAQNDCVIVRRQNPDRTTESGIIIAGGSKRSNRGTVVSVGMGKPNEEPPSVSIGNTVVFAEHAGVTINHEGEDLVVLRGEDIFARVVSAP